MGFFKNVFGYAVDEMKKSIEDSKEEMLKSLNETKREALGSLGIKFSEAFKSDYDEKMFEEVETSTNEEPRKQGVKAITKSTSGNGQDTGKKIWWVKDLSVLYDGNKYALKYTGKQGQITKYIYDDVDILNEYQVRFAKKQADGSLRYGVASTCGWSFIMTDCEYIKVTFLDGYSAVLAVDEEDDEYAIDRWGKIFSIEGYREEIEKNLQDD